LLALTKEHWKRFLSLLVALLPRLLQQCLVAVYLVQDFLRRVQGQPRQVWRRLQQVRLVCHCAAKARH
jgi:hypothetical protein